MNVDRVADFDIWGGGYAVGGDRRRRVVGDGCELEAEVDPGRVTSAAALLRTRAGSEMPRRGISKKGVIIYGPRGEAKCRW